MCGVVQCASFVSNGLIVLELDMLQIGETALDHSLQRCLSMLEVLTDRCWPVLVYVNHLQVMIRKQLIELFPQQ